MGMMLVIQFESQLTNSSFSSSLEADAQQCVLPCYHLGIIISHLALQDKMQPVGQHAMLH